MRKTIIFGLVFLLLISSVLGSSFANYTKTIQVGFTPNFMFSGSNSWITNPNFVENKYGDINGDGVDDIFKPFGYNDTFYGYRNISFFLNKDIKEINETEGVHILHSNESNLSLSTGDYFENYEMVIKGVWSIGDFNNDGYDDTLISYQSNLYNYQGHLALFYGSESPKFNISDINGNISFRLRWWNQASSVDDNVFLGASQRESRTCALGDINGDGYDDFMTSRYSVSLGGSPYVLYIVFGGKDIDFDYNLVALANVTDVVDYIPVCKGIGDINNDGIDDFYMNNKIFFGGENFETYFDANIGNMTLTDIPSYVGDINGDNLNDIITLDYGLYTNSVADGETIKIYYQQNPVLTELNSSNANKVINSGANYSFSQSILINYDADSYSDMVVGIVLTNGLSGLPAQSLLIKGVDLVGMDTITNDLVDVCYEFPTLYFSSDYGVPLGFTANNGYSTGDFNRNDAQTDLVTNNIYLNYAIPVEETEEVTETNETIPELGFIDQTTQPRIEIIEIDCYNQTVFDLESLTEKLTGEEVIVSQGDILFSLTTDVGTDNFDILSRAGDERTRNLYVTNNGLSDITLLVGCQGVFCSNVRYAQTELHLASNEQKSIKLTLKVPDSASDGDVFQFNTIVSLDKKPDVAGVVSGRIEVNAFLGQISQAISFENLFNDGLQLGSLLISNIVLAFGSAVTYFFAITISMNVIKPTKNKRLKFELIRWLGFVALFVILILIL